jgi:uncharacterized protein (TIGR03643 family)
MTPPPVDHADLERIVEMAWEDRTPFDAIARQFGLSERAVILLLRRQLPAGAFRRWRARVSGRRTKHERLRQPDVLRHRAPGHNKLGNRRP